MLVTLANTEALQAAGGRQFSADPTGRAGVAEALRCELSARGVTSGRGLCERVQSLLQPLGFIDTTRIREVLDELADRGDVTAGPRGLFAAAPVRAVRLSEECFALYGTFPTHLLRPELSGMELHESLARRVRLSGGPGNALVEVVARLGGLILSPQRWAGLDRVPSAGPEWLEEMAYRLQEAALPPGSLDHDRNAAWQAYRPEGGERQRQRWRTTRDSDPPATLWRGRDENGWWRFAWTDGGSPSTHSHARLGRDEACRTSFALDRMIGKSLVFSLHRGESVVEMDTDAFLPLAEYRYLTTLSERVEAEDTARYRMPATAWDDVATTLRERLGVAFTEELS